MHRLRTIICLVALASAGCGVEIPFEQVRPAALSVVGKDAARPLASRDRRGAGITPDVDVEGRKLTLRECMQIALERSPRTRAALEYARAAAAQVGVERSAFLPTLDLAARTGRGDPGLTEGSGDRGVSDTTSAGLSLGYVLYDGGARSARRAGASAAYAASGLAYKASTRDLLLAVETAYHEYLAAKELVHVAGESARRARYHVELARARHEGGLVAKSDVLRAQTLEAEAELGAVRAKSTLRRARASLASAMGLPANAEIDVDGVTDSTSMLPRDAGPEVLSGLVEEAVSARPELAAARAREEELGAAASAARAGRRPVVTASAEVGMEGRDYSDWEEEWSVGLGVAVPLYDGSRTRNLVRKSEALVPRSRPSGRALRGGSSWRS